MTPKSVACRYNSFGVIVLQDRIVSCKVKECFFLTLLCSLQLLVEDLDVLWYSVSCSSGEVNNYCSTPDCAAIYEQTLHNTFHAVSGTWDIIDESARQWGFSQNLVGEVLTAFSTSEVYFYNAAADIFEKYQRNGQDVAFSTVGASDIEMFTINPPPTVLPGAATVSSIPRHFIAVANK